MPESESHVVEDMTLEAAATRAGVSPHTIRRAMKKGLIKRCNRAKEAPRFSIESVQEYIAWRETDGADGVSNASNEIQIAQADTITGMLSQAQTHAENFASRAADLLDSSTKHVQTAVDALIRENSRLQKRIDTLESHEDELQETLEKLRKDAYDTEIAKGIAEANKEKARHWIKEARVFGPAILAALFGKDGTVTETAFSRLLSDLEPSEVDGLMTACYQTLKPDHLAALMMIVKEKAAKEPGEGGAAPANAA